MGRSGSIDRSTRETSIRVEIDLDGSGKRQIDTPLPFLSHMLDQVARHGMVDLRIEAKGDVEIDGHHTTEDVGLALGQAVSAALGDRAGIRRYGSATLPMDEACVTCAIDFSGRPFLVFQVPLPKAKVGEFDVELAEVFFDAFARGAGCNLHLHLVQGQILHHIVEISFKAFARSLRQAVEHDPRSGEIPSTKGTLAD